MKPLSSLKVQQLCFLAKPKCDRAIYRHIKKHKVRSVVEFGLGTTQRTTNMIRLAQKFCGNQTVRYTGIDLFEGNPDPRHSLELIQVHKRLATLGAKIQLVPGSIDQAIPRIANSHMRTDLIVVSSCYLNEELNQCWSFFPRMLCATSVLLLQPEGDEQGAFQPLSRMAIERIAKRTAHSDKPLSMNAAA